MVQGMVFDIQRFSLQDGPGIRTTVFLKGCPLRCVWCHNPESQRRQPEVMWDEKACVLCARCVSACPEGRHTAGGSQHAMDRQGCAGCGACARECLFGALEVKGTQMGIEEVMAEVTRDFQYYRHTAGGMTLSGGEPMAQPAFTRGLLEAARAAGIHTCVETCGWAPWEEFEAILPSTDLFLFDYKATDTALHEQLTGVPCEPIVANLHRLMASGAPVILRCPLVPGVNDDDGHLAAIASLWREYGGTLHVELMAYHNLGTGKEQKLGREPSLASLPNVGDDLTKQWLAKLADMGCDEARIG